MNKFENDNNENKKPKGKKNFWNFLLFKLSCGKKDNCFKVYNDFNANNYSKTLIEEAYNNFIRENGVLYDFDNFRASISTYAMAKDDKGNYIYDETIAEAFHDVYLNGTNAKIASRYIVSVLEKYI